MKRHSLCVFPIEKSFKDSCQELRAKTTDKTGAKEKATALC